MRSHIHIWLDWLIKNDPLYEWDRFRAITIFCIFLAACAHVWALRFRHGPRFWWIALLGMPAVLASALSFPGTPFSIILAVGGSAWFFCWTILGVDRNGGSRKIYRVAPALLCMLVAGASSLSLHVLWRAQADERTQAREEMRRRPGDFWPRGGGHIPFAEFGAKDEDKGWLEAGGSFSPSFVSFGIAVWTVRADGEVMTTSDTVRLADTHQAYVASGQTLALDVATPTYGLRYEAAGQHAYRLTVAAPKISSQQLELVVRSTGPAGGPVTQIDWKDEVLRINGRWQIDFPAGAKLIGIGDERNGGLRKRMNVVSDHVRSADGWGYARILLPPRDVRLQIEDVSVGASAAAVFPPPSGCVLDGFPAEFTTMIETQRTNLLLGISGDEPRPGDPINYPLAWQRDGAYTVVALARSGQKNVARLLSAKFARDDFFGGFGAEGDAPGLALWALAETAVALRDRSFASEVWPDVQRKVKLIESLRTAKGEIRHAFVGPVVPTSLQATDNDLVAYPSERGLIVARMDGHKPLFYINAVSYLGLVEAANIAAMLGETADAARWSAEAISLREAYRTAMASHDPDITNARTAISGLYPSDAAEPEIMRQVLTERWAQDHDSADGFRVNPMWTYFDFAEAHQWLRLGEVDKVHAVLDWFKARDRLPGIGVFWEGDGEENSFGKWPHARGNLYPTGVTPHYWTAAEALLLHLEMLAYVDRQQKSTVVIGAGLPAAWLSRPLRVDAVGTALGPVSWYWDGKHRLDVSLPGEMPVRPGPNFPKDIDINAVFKSGTN